MGFAFGVILVLVFLLGSILGIVSMFRLNRLEQEVRQLRNHIQTSAAQPAAAKGAEKPVTAPAPLTPQKSVSDVPAGFVSVPAPVDNPPKRAAAKLVPKPPIRPKRASEKKPRQSFEEALGAKWSVWVGGVALLFGAVFLLRYTIEAGVFTPMMRVAMAAVFGTALMAAGEYLRRKDKAPDGKPGKAERIYEKAYIPGVITAVGIFALLGSVFAAYELYNLIGAQLAFILMGAISLGALWLGLIHGPSLAALGLVASLTTPWLIKTNDPNAYALFGYLTLICIAALVLARRRDWGWLYGFTLFGALIWIFIGLPATREIGTYMAWVGFTGLMFAISTYVASRSQDTAPILKPLAFTYGPRVSAIWAALAALAVFAAAEMNGFGRTHYLIGLGFAAILMAIAWIKPRQSWNLLTGGVLGCALIVSFADQDAALTEIYLTSGVLTVSFAFLCFTRLPIKLGLSRQELQDSVWALAVVLLPLSLFLSLQNIEDVTDQLTGLTMLGLLAVFAVSSFLAWRKYPDKTVAIAIYAVGAAIAYVLAVLISLEGMTETVCLIAGIGFAALAALKMPLTINRAITTVFALGVAVFVLKIKIPDPASVGTQVIFNELWIYFAVPSFLCGLIAWRLFRTKSDIWSEGLKALALVFAALFLVFQIRHLMNDGSLMSDQLSFDELALQVLVGLSFTLGGSLIAPKPIGPSSPVHERILPLLTNVAKLLTLTAFVFGICIFSAPLFNGSIPINGGMIFNSLMIAYLMPAILLAGNAWFSRTHRTPLYSSAMAGLSLMSIMVYVTSMIRKGFSGARISIFNSPPDDVELYAISAAWLLIGIALLAIGLKMKRQDVRIASAALIVLTVLKAFLIDMASLQGVLRAMSFVVLGLVLIVIGRAYQRMLFSKTAAD